jgi:hypothetical protein
MSKKHDRSKKGGHLFASDSAIVLSFIVAFEILIMISPFAAFFYYVFNPFLLALNQSSITRWLTAFFLPHMVAPPNEVLAAIRILGSVLFVAGMVVFLVCAAQVYLGKLFKAGDSHKGAVSLCTSSTVCWACTHRIGACYHVAEITNARPLHAHAFSLLHSCKG